MSKNTVLLNKEKEEAFQHAEHAILSKVGENQYSFNWMRVKNSTITGVQGVFCPGRNVLIRLYYYCFEFKSKKCKKFEFIYLKKLNIYFKIRKFI